MRTFGRPSKTSSSFGRFARNAISDRCAIVNESIAPNEYIVPRKSTFPGRERKIEMTPPKNTIEIHGVLNSGARV